MKKYMTFLWLLFCVACQSQAEKSYPDRLLLPDIPSQLTDVTQRADWLVLHYWDHFDFSDTLLIGKEQITEQGFVDFLQILPVASSDSAHKGVLSLLQKAITADSLMYAHFCDLYEKYLYEANSPFRDEERLIPALEYMVSQPMISHTDKIRHRYLLSMVQKNRIGTLASDFEFTTAKGKKTTLCQIQNTYILLFFGVPDCQECLQTKQYIDNSLVFERWIKERKKMTVVVVYPQDDIELFKTGSYPVEWINGYHLHFHQADIYDLKATPTLYLLDHQHKVILKDVTAEQIEKFLEDRD